MIIERVIPKDMINRVPLEPWRGFTRGSNGKVRKRTSVRKKPHQNGAVVEKDKITPEMVDPYTKHPDVYSMDVRGHMSSDAIIYNAAGTPIERILADTRERVPFGQKPAPVVERPLIRALAPARRRMRENFSKDAVVIAAALPNSSPRLAYSGIVRKLNPGV